jgi:prophage antirepressor-like protein|nr:MAG TPA: hypothetical protein [Caudoviricetes sp.]
MNELQVFNFQENQVRTQNRNNEIWFCLKDVCSILEIKNHKDVISRLNLKGVDTIDTLTKGGLQKMNFINESNLYKVIFQSRKPQAEQFTEWVTSEVLPTLRRTGSYRLPQTPEEKIQLLLEANQSANAKIDKVEERVTNLEDNRFLNPNEYGYLNTQISARVKEVKEVLHLECDRKQNSELFRSIGREIKQIAGVKCRSQLRYKDFDKVLDFIRTWEPSKATLYTIQQIPLEL